MSRMDVLRDAQRVVATLGYAEALVQFELLHRWEETGILEQTGAFQNQAEERVISDLTASLKPIIDEAFADAYAETLARARAEVRDSDS